MTSIICKLADKVLVPGPHFIGRASGKRKI